MRKLKQVFLLVIIAASFASCSSIKEYQKMALNDKDMELSDKKIKVFETNFQSYREGASGANGGKSGGGCGCN